MERGLDAILESSGVRESGREGQGQERGPNKGQIQRAQHGQGGGGNGVHVCIGEHKCMWHTCSYARHVCVHGYAYVCAQHTQACMYMLARHVCMHNVAHKHMCVVGGSLCREDVVHPGSSHGGLVKSPGSWGGARWLSGGIG